MATQLPSVYVYVDKQLAETATVLARLTGQSLGSFTRRAIRELFASGQVPHLYAMDEGARSHKLRAHLPEELKDQLVREAEHAGVSTSALAAGALATYTVRLLSDTRDDFHAEVARRKALRAQHSAEGASL